MGHRPEEDEGATRQVLVHDLLQSVAIIRAVVSASRQALPSTRQLDANLAMVEVEVEVIAGLCEQHLGEPRPMVSIDLGEIARRVVQRIEVAYAGQIEITAERSVIEMVDDPLAWERAVMNLTENACRAAGADGKVSVRCYHRGERFCVSVGDSGPGFGEAPAGRASLGIVSVTALVDRHGGHIELRRSPLGGAQLTIVIPTSA